MGDVLAAVFIKPFEWVGVVVLWLYRLLFKTLPRAWKWFRGHKEAGSLGSAEFADDKALEAAGRLAASGMLAMVTKSKKRVYCDREASLITIGQKGLGKTQSMIAMVRALKDMQPRAININGAILSKVVRPDLVIYDPKTGVLKATRSELEAMGYKVRVVDLRKPDQSEYLFDALNIIDVTHQFDFDRQVDSLARLISPPAAHGKNDHFEAYPRIMIAGVIKHLMTQGPVSLSQCVEKLITSSKVRDKLFQDMGFSRDTTVLGAVEAFMAAGDREKGSFITTNFEKMKFWLRPSVRWMLEGSGQRTPDDLAKLGWTWEQVFDDPQPVATFIIGGLGNGEGNLVRLMVGNAINSAQRRFNESELPLKKPLWMLVDECHTLGNCEAVMSINRELREAGVSLAMWWLDYEDGQKTYPEWSTLLGGCDLIVYGDSNDMKWYEFIEKILGKYTTKTESENSHGKSSHEALRSLKSASELAELEFEECIGVFRSRKGRKKVFGGKPFYIKDDAVRFY